MEQGDTEKGCVVPYSLFGVTSVLAPAKVFEVEEMLHGGISY